MKTLILNGSPHANGDTAALVNILKQHLEGEIHEISCYRSGISPCVDCRRCMREPGCAIQDEMQALYPLLAECDCIVIASPVYFSQPTPPLMAVASRLQTWFCASRFRREPVNIKPKTGGIIFTGGGSGSAEPAVETARMLLRCMRVKKTGPIVLSTNTDQLRAREDASAIEAAACLAHFLNNNTPE